MTSVRSLVTPLAPLFVAAMIWVGAVNTIPIVDEIRYGMASRDWPATVGTVESSWLEVRQGRSYRRIPHVTYRYALGGDVRHAKRVGASSQHQRAEALVAEWRPGTQVQVYYDPETGMPALVRGYNGSAWLWLALMVFLTAVPAMLLVAGARAWFAARRAQLRP